MNDSGVVDSYNLWMEVGPLMNNRLQMAPDHSVRPWLEVAK